jgi:hypothetical protein
MTTTLSPEFHKSVEARRKLTAQQRKIAMSIGDYLAAVRRNKTNPPPHLRCADPLEYLRHVAKELDADPAVFVTAIGIKSF